MRNILISLIAFICLLSFSAVPETSLYSPVYKIQPDQIDPQIENGYPAGRGPDQLVLYSPEYGNRTGTNLWGIEATIKNGIITHIGGNNSVIPRDGFVLSGHGKGKIHILQNLKQGMEFRYDIDNKTCEIQYTPRCFVYLLRNKHQELVKKGFSPEYHSSDTINKKLKWIDKRIVKLEKRVDQQKRIKEKDLKKIELALKEVFWMQYPVMGAQRSITINLKDLQNNHKELMKVVSKYDVSSIYLDYLTDGACIDQDSAGFDKTDDAVTSGNIKALLAPLTEKGISIYFRISPLKIDGKSKYFTRKHGNWLAENKNSQTLFHTDKSSYLCPSNNEYQAYLTAFIEKVSKEYPLTGIVLTDIYIPENSCYCEDCCKSYFLLTGIDPKYQEIDENDPVQKKRWLKWREALVGDLTKMIHQKLPEEMELYVQLDHTDTNKIRPDFYTLVKEGNIDGFLATQRGVSSPCLFQLKKDKINFLLGYIVMDNSQSPIKQAQKMIEKKRDFGLEISSLVLDSSSIYHKQQKKQVRETYKKLFGTILKSEE